MPEISSRLSAALVDRYRIERTLGGGGFGIVYVARDRATATKVIVKEYMPSRLAHRDANHEVRPLGDADAPRFSHGRTLFLQEARTLASMILSQVLEAA